MFVLFLHYLCSEQQSFLEPSESTASPLPRPPHEVYLHSACPDYLVLPEPTGMGTYLPACRVGRDTPRLPAPTAHVHPSATRVNLCRCAGSSAGDDLCYHHDQPLDRKR